MSEILQDFSVPALVAAIKANRFAWLRYVGRSSQAELYESAEAMWVLTGIPHFFSNAILRTHVEPDQADTIIERVLAHLRSSNATMVSWWVESDSRPSDLGRYLTAHGLTYVEGASGMAADLLALHEDLTLLADLTIVPVRNTDTLRQWAYASIVGFGIPETSIDRWFDVFAGLGFDLPLRNYVGILNGELVATSNLFLGAGVAGIYAVATIPEVRRQGIGAAMTLAPLREARALGYRIGILHSSSMGMGVYRQLGFEEYCRMSHYQWVDEAGND